MINDPQSVSLWQTNIQYVNRCLTLTCLYSYITVIQSKFFKSLFAWFFFSINVQKHPTVAPWHTAGLKSHTGAHHAVMLVTHTHTLTLSLYGDDTGKKKKGEGSAPHSWADVIYRKSFQLHSNATVHKHKPTRIVPLFFFLGLNSSRSHTQKRKHDQVVFHHICAQSLTPDPDRSLSRLCAPPPHHHLHPVTVMCLYVFHPQARYSTVQYSWRLCKSKLKNCCLLFLWLILQ